MIDLKKEALDELRNEIAIRKADAAVEEAKANYIARHLALQKSMAAIESDPEFVKWLGVARVKASVAGKEVVSG